MIFKGPLAAMGAALSADAGIKAQARRRAASPPGTWPGARSFRRASCALTMAVSLTLVAGCGGADAAHTGGLERTRLVVGTLPVPDAAPLFIALQRGFFKQEGLDVRTTIIQAGPMAVPALKSGSMDISLTNFVSAIAAEDAGAVHWKFLANSYQSAKNAFVVLAAAKSSVRGPKDLAGKKIAVPALRAIGTLTIAASLAGFGLEGDEPKFVEMGFPQMAAALEAGRVDAIWVAEPFIVDAERTIGARPVLDTSAPSSPTEGFPVAGWGVLDSWAKRNPRSAAAFQRAIGKAQRLAAADRGLVSRTLPTYIKGINPDTAGVVTLGTYPTSLSPVRLQRVADLMKSYGYTQRRVDVGPMIVPAPAQTT